MHEELRNQGPTPRGVRIPEPLTMEEEMPHPIVGRLALEVLWRELTYRVAGTLEPEEEAVNRALTGMHAMLWRREMEAVAKTGLNAHYLIVRPINPMNMPRPEEAAEIAAAIETLHRHDMIARAWTDE